MALDLKPKNQSGSNQEHALLSPSGSKKWLGCPAALACEMGIPNESGQAAVNGTAMHSLSEAVLNRILSGSKADASTYLSAYVLNDGKGPVKALAKAQKGAVLITDDFVSQVTKYVDYCRPIIDAAEEVEIEYRVNLSRILHPGATVSVRDRDGVLTGEKAPLKTFGTADLVAIVKRTDGTYMLIVGDLKTGRHKVTAKENKQMMIYALGLLKVFRELYDITAVRLVIFQPYAGGADEWDTTPEALDIFAKFASKAALKAIDAWERGKKGLKPADFRPSNDACEWCRFSEKCNAKRKAVGSGFVGGASDDDLADPPKAATPGEMTTVELKAEWDKLPLMRKHIADIEKAMYAALMKGEKVDGLKLVEGKPGNRSWDMSDEDVVDTMLDAGVEPELMYTQKVINPTAAEKVLAKSHPRLWRRLSKHVTRKDGAPSIAPADDNRPEYQAVKDSDLENE